MDVSRGCSQVHVMALGERERAKRGVIESIRRFWRCLGLDSRAGGSRTGYQQRNLVSVNLDSLQQGITSDCEKKYIRVRFAPSPLYPSLRSSLHF